VSDPVFLGEFARSTNANTPVVSPNFSVTADDIVVCFVHLDAGGIPPTPTTPSQTWTLVDGVLDPGFAVYWTKAASTTSTFVITIPPDSTIKIWAHAYKVTGADSTDPIGAGDAAGSSGLTTNNLTVSITPESHSEISYIIAGANEYFELGAITSSDLTVNQLNGGTGYTGWTDGATGWKQLAALDTSDSFNFDAGGSGSAWWVHAYIQIKMAAGGTTVPDAPTSLVATPGDTQVSLTFVAPASDGGAAITDYKAEYRTTTGPGSWTPFSDATSTALAITVTGLTNGTSYDFQVRAVNSVGDGAWSATATATPAAPPPFLPITGRSRRRRLL
jgi:hypothetical protein